ncbi:MAG TPA: hypothetical protein VGR89_06590 [Puia sp.]|nr:hypothetical protein [Puia sp.]
MRHDVFTWALILALTVCAAKGQGFMNLDFESARISIIGTNELQPFIATTNALPDWSAFWGAGQLSSVDYNPNDFAAFTAVYLEGSNSEVLIGNFSVGLVGDGSIRQTGLVPADAESLLFDAFFSASQSSSPLAVSLDGQDLTYSAISSAVNSSGETYTIYGADIAAFAGQDETLTFSCPQGSSGTDILDDIQFSTMIVPEPSMLSLIFGSCGILIYARYRFQKKTNR